MRCRSKDLRNEEGAEALRVSVLFVGLHGLMASCEWDHCRDIHHVTQYRTQITIETHPKAHVLHNYYSIRTPSAHLSTGVQLSHTS
jgi:hypothetical protein